MPSFAASPRTMFLRGSLPLPRPLKSMTMMCSVNGLRPPLAGVSLGFGPCKPEVPEGMEAWRGLGIAAFTIFGLDIRRNVYDGIDEIS